MPLLLQFRDSHVPQGTVQGVALAMGEDEEDFHVMFPFGETRFNTTYRHRAGLAAAELAMGSDSFHAEALSGRAMDHWKAVPVTAITRTAAR